jgi:hypothetical protein
MVGQEDIHYSHDFTFPNLDHITYPSIYCFWFVANSNMWKASSKIKFKYPKIVGYNSLLPKMVSQTF